MANKTSFAAVDLLIVDGKAHHRSSLRHVLSDLGFCEIRISGSLAEVHNAFAIRMPDFMIADSNLEDGDIGELITNIRHHKMGHNPFLPVFIMTWDPSPELVHSMVNAGADDILVRPTSRNRLLERINLLTFNRKPFVVTSTYIGPDRRPRARAAEQTIPLMEVPNTLLARATGQSGVIEMQRAIDAMTQEVNSQKLYRNALHIDHTVGLLLPAFQEDFFNDVAKLYLHEILFAAEDLTRRVINTEHAHISKLCRSLISVTVRLGKSSSKAEDKDLKLLPKLATAIKIAFDNSQDTAKAAARISDVVEQRANT